LASEAASLYHLNLPSFPVAEASGAVAYQEHPSTGDMKPMFSFKAFPHLPDQRALKLYYSAATKAYQMVMLCLRFHLITRMPIIKVMLLYYTQLYE
jgi:hypothetical protein